MQSSRSFRRIAIIAVAVIILVPLAAVAIFIASFDPNSYKPQIVAAVERATGRNLAIQGRLRMTMSLVPTISASGITLANPPGYADANFATLRRVDAQVALLPLLSHRLDILKLVLIDPAINLEYDATGRPDWLFGAEGAASSGAPAAAAAPGTHQAIALQSVSIQNGTLTYRPAPRPVGPAGTVSVAPAPAPTVLSIAHFTGSADSLDAPLRVSMQATYDNAPFGLDGTMGPVSRLTGSGAGGWPVDIVLSGGDARLHVKGSVAHPRHLRGYALALHATVPKLSTLAPYLQGFLGGIVLPPLRSVDARARISGNGPGTLPAIGDVRITAGRSNLDSWRKGLSIASLNISLASLDQPVTVALAGAYQGKPVGLEGNAGPVGPILQGAQGEPAKAPAANGRFTVDLAGKVGGAQFSVAGAIATPTRLAGVALKLSGRIPNLAHLSDLAGMPLPAWTNIGLSGLLTDPGGQGLENAIGLDSLAVSADQAQLGGAFSLRRGPTPDLQAVIDAPRVDLTALLKAMPKPAANAAAATTGNAVAPVAPASRDVIPATPIPFDLLRKGDGNVELTIGQLMYDGATYDAITAHGLLRKGVLTVRPISAELPGGSVSGTLDVNAMANPPTIHVTEAAPAFRLAPLLTVLGLPNAAGATVQLYADLSGAGNTPRGVAATLNGRLGISSVNGEIDGALLDRLFGPTLAAAGLPGSVVGSQGPVEMRCFAGRIDAKNGLASVRALTLDSSRLYLTGTGTIDLGAERLNLILRPQMQLDGGNAPVPVALSGDFAHPRTGLAPPGAYGQTLASLAQQLGRNHGTVLGRFAQQLGLTPPPPDPQSCVGALALARMGHPGPAPAAATVPPPSSGAPAQGQSGNSGPQNLLRSLFH